MSTLVDEFSSYREKTNVIILGKNNLVMKRLWNLAPHTRRATEYWEELRKVSAK